MSNTNTGGPAFPTTEKHDYNNDYSGMTLRDYFATKAMQSFMTVWMTQAKYPKSDLIVAEHAYAMADAMLKARNA